MRDSVLEAFRDIAKQVQQYYVPIEIEVAQLGIRKKIEGTYNSLSRNVRVLGICVPVFELNKWMRLFYGATVVEVHFTKEGGRYDAGSGKDNRA